MTLIDLIRKTARFYRREGFQATVRRGRRYLTDRLWVWEAEPTAEELEAQRRWSQLQPDGPLISIIMPVYNTPPKLLTEAIASVGAQTYPRWQLCIANGSPDSAGIAAILEEYPARDSRIRVITLGQNLGIAGNTNAAINLAEGEFVGFLDHDDTLAPCALYEVARATQTEPGTDVLYSDEDILNERGRVSKPFYKPAFSPDFLRFANYMCHFLVIRKSLGDRLGWFQPGFDGAQDYDLVLRCVEQATCVTHIPRVLYHWRESATSTAKDVNLKPYAAAAGMRALRDHVERIHLARMVEPGPLPTTYLLHFLCSAERGELRETPRVSILIPNHDHLQDLRVCIESIRAHTDYPCYEIIIAENNSTDPAVFAYYRDLEASGAARVVTWNQTPFNFSAVNNFLVEQAAGEIILFLNNDIQVLSDRTLEVHGDWLANMVMEAVRPEVGGVGAKLLYPNRTVQHGGVILGVGGVAGHAHKGYPADSYGDHCRLVAPQDLTAVTGACLMMRRDVFRQVGGFDPAYRLAFGDVDLCLRVREQGYLIVWTPLAELIHHESRTRGWEDTPEKRARFESEVAVFKQRWREQLSEGDPYYNPNLTLTVEDLSRARIPTDRHPRSLPGLGNRKPC